MISFFSAINWSDIFKASMVLFAVIDIIGSIPMIIKLKENSGDLHPMRAALVSLAIMIGFLIVGENILKLFGVGVSSFAVAGSLILFAMSLEMILGRFDELPLHRHCYYYRSQPHIEQTMDSTTRAWFNEEVSRLPAHGLQQDCFGMTPLHVLLCSSAGCDVRVCQCMIEKYPGAMLIEDRWGEVPLVYALFGEAPIEVIHFLLESHMQRWRAMPFDFGVMILRLAKKLGTSAEYVRDVIWAQRTHHRALEIDWQRIVDESIRARRDIPIRMFSILVEASVSKRLVCMSDEHRIEVDARLREIETNIENRDFRTNPNLDYYGEIHDMVTSYVRLHHGQLKEAITILELAFWNLEDHDMLKCQ